MNANFGKRILSLLLAVIMVLSLLPTNAHTHAHAETTETHDHSQETTVSEAYAAIQAKIDEMLTYYLGSTTATQAEIEAAVAAMDSNTVWMAQVEIADIQAEAEETLTEDELTALNESNAVLAAFSAELSEASSGPSLLAVSGSLTDTNIGLSNSNGTWTASGTGITGTYTVYSFGGTATLTITNNRTAPCILYFDYTTGADDSASYVSISGGTATTKKHTGTTAVTSYYETTLAANESVTVTLKVDTAVFADRTTSISITNLVAKGQVTFGTAVNGSYTVNGATPPASSTDACGTTYDLIATPADGYVFVGWFIDDSTTAISTETTYTYTNQGNVTITPKFAEPTMTVEFAAAEGNGSYTVNGEAPTTKKEAIGTVYNLVATPNSEVNIFDGWYKDDATEPFSTESSITLTTGQDILENCKIYAKFRDLAHYTITTEGDTTLGAISGGGAYYEGYSATLTATANSGTTFLGWTKENGEILTTNATYTFTPTEDMTVKAWFVNSNSAPHFAVGTVSSGEYKDASSLGTFLGTTVTYYNVAGTHLFDDLNEAATYASGADSKYVVLMNSGTLAAGTYTIPSGVTLLIPFDSSNTLYTTAACSTGTYTTPTAYRTLTLASGAELVVNGALSVSGKHMRSAAGMMNGSAPTGPQGFIATQSGSTITVNGSLYAYGYITGSGSVTANSGATVYELFQIGDFRGGTQTLDMDNAVFPLSQYYVQNIEVPLTIYAGAKEYSYTTIYMSSAAIASSVSFIGADCMFNLTEGYVVKRYDGSTDRTIIDSYGTLSVTPVTMKVGTGSINTAEYILPIGGSFTVNINSGSITLGQDVALLPGSQINVAAGATCAVGSGVSVYVYDGDTWGTYCWGNISGTQQNVAFVPVIYAPSRTYTRTAADLVDAQLKVAGTIDASAGYLYTTSSGAEIVGVEGGKVKINPAADGITYQVMQNTSNETDTYVEIAVTSAKLKNADGTFVDTSATAANYTYTNGVWVMACVTHTPGEAATCTKEQTCTVCGAVLAEKTAHTPGAEATCTAAQTCTVCGETLAEAKGHTEVTLAAVAATCTTAGLTEGKKCSVCGEVLVAQTEVAALGHTPGETEEENVKAATCQDGSKDLVVYCTVCNVELSRETVTIEAATDHSWNDGSVTKETSCAAPGEMTYTCTVCNETKTEKIEKLEHISNGETVDCTTAETCSVCKNVITPALDHTAGEAVKENENKETGYYEEVVYCTVCGGEVSRRAYVPGAVEHTLVYYDRVEPTCTTTGLTAGAECTDENCGACINSGSAYVLPQEVIPALGHTLNDVVAITYTWKTSEDGGMTCTATGACARCGVEHSVTATSISWTTVAPTCTEQGYTVYTAVFAEEEGIDNGTQTTDYAPAPGHAYSIEYIWNTEDADNVTCTATRTCANDSQHTTSESAIVTKIVTAATCETAGYITYTADFSYEYFEDQETVVAGDAAIGHSWTVTSSTWSADNATCTVNLVCANNANHTQTGIVSTDVTVTGTEATCEADGSLTYTATFAAEWGIDPIVKTETPAALGHSWGEPKYKWGGLAYCEAARSCTRNCGAEETEKVAPTCEVTANCTQAGQTIYTAAFTNEVFETQVLTYDTAALGHTTTLVPASAATCKVTGNNAYYTCSACGGIFKDENGETTTTVAAETIGIQPHSYTSYASNGDATCTADGTKTASCDFGCGNTSVVTDTGSKLAHRFTNYISDNNATCKADGTKTASCDYGCETKDTVTDAGTKKEHDYVGVVTLAPTCLEEGVMTYTCQNGCNDSYTEAIAPLNHSYNGGEVTIPATCTTEGVMTYTCNRCTADTEGHSYTETIAKVAHTYQAVVTDPTCTEQGYTTYTCSVCGDTYKADYITELGHDYVSVVTEPTCTEQGYTTHTCQVCNEDTADHSYVDSYVDALGHSYDDGVVTTEPTCVDKGVKTFTCTVCAEGTEGRVYTKEVDALGHDYESVVTEPTCTEQGYTTHTCQVCNEDTADHSYVDSYVDALGHSYDDGVVTTEPTCVDKGVKTFTCTVCAEGTEGRIYTEEVDALGHDYESVVTEPTCTEQGYTTHTCPDCGDTYQDDYTDALGHDYESVVTAPTCEEKGYTTYTCHCGDTYVSDEVAATGHKDDDTDHTCDNGCGVYQGTHEDANNDHVCDYGCTEAVGEHADVTTDEDHLCDYCNQQIGDHEYTEGVCNCGYVQDLTVNVTIKATGASDVVLEETTTKYGQVYSVTLDFSSFGNCYTMSSVDVKVGGVSVNYSYSTTNVLSIAEYNVTGNIEIVVTAIQRHTMGPSEYVDYKAPTCTEAGESTIKIYCADCNVVIDTVTTPIPATNHKNTVVVDAAVEPTCTETGLTEGSHCSACGEVLVAQETVDAKGHTEVVDAAKEPTCTETGLTEGKHCSVCGEVLVAQETVDAKGHTEVVDAAKEPTCTETGLTEGKHCSVCDEILVAQETVDAKGHTEVVDAAKEPTCTETGLTEGKHCSVCGEVLVAQDVVPALNHAWDEGVVTENPTCTEVGVKTFTCANDASHTYTEEVEALGHSYSAVVTAPTCEDKGYTTYTCSRCSDSYVDDYVEALGHSYSAVVTAPTCEDKGYTTYTCSRCSDSYVDDYVEALGHSYVGKVTKNPTCTGKGVMTYTCQNDASHVYTEEIAALGHNYTITYTWNADLTECTASAVCQNNSYHVVSGTAVVTLRVDTAATCEADGVGTQIATFSNTLFATQEATVTLPKLGHSYTNYVSDGNATCTEDGTMTAKCDNGCGETHTVTETGSAKGHTMTLISANAPTCTTDGNNAYYTCGVCGGIYKDADGVEATTAQEQKLPMTGHNYDAVVTAPTCTIPGYTTHTCQNGCGSTYTDSYVAATGHSYDAGVVTTAPTCTTTGVKTFTCSVCGGTKTESVAALGHTKVTDAYVAATCTETGLTAGEHCSVCDEVLVAQNVIPAKGHTNVDLPAKAPTCTATGLTAGVKCSVCGEILTVQEIVPAKGHTPGTAVTENVKAPTCTATGSHDEVVYCTVCKAEVSRTTVTDAALGHTETEIPAKAPTCTATGLTAGVKCSVCNEVLTAQEKVDALGHTEVSDPAVESTCTATGLTEGKHCSVCGTVTVVQTTVEMKAHALSIVSVTPATCTQDGSQLLRCINCGYETTEAIPATGHTEAELPAKTPTCAATGLTAGVKCAVCGEIMTAQEEIPALGHTYESVVTAPTCTAQGYTTHTCAVCGDIKVDTYVSFAPHTEVVDPAVAATCTTTGLTEGKHCSVCGAVTVAQREVAIQAHTEAIDAAVAATCTETGLTEGKHCSVCGKVLVAQTETPATGHTETTVAAKAPTCDKTGLTEGTKCSVCGVVLTAQQEVPALGHTWDEGRVTKEPTCTVVGVRTFTCSVCDGTKTEDEPVLGHDLVPHAAKLPTYSSVGWDAYESCSRCDYSTYVEIPVLAPATVDDFETFMEKLAVLEELAYEYALANPGKDPLALVIKYIRTGVDRYNSGSWGIMAGYEDAGFAAYVAQYDENYNLTCDSTEDMISIAAMKNINNFYLPNGDYVDFGHMFGTMDISYHNKNSVNHADVAGWAGDLVDLLSTADRHGVTGTVEEMTANISANYLGVSLPEEDIFSMTDIYGDLDGFYAIEELKKHEYESGTLHSILEAYFTAELTSEARADYFLENRLGGVSTQINVRNAVYNNYTANNVVATLEGTREFTSDSVADLRRACCYAFADYLCQLAGDWVEIDGNDYYTVFSSEMSTLAPGITQEIKQAYTADDKQVVFYIATADLTRDDVHVYANYRNNDPTEWGMQRVLDQANAAQAKYGDPNSEYYIENYNVITSINADGFNMVTGEPGGLLVMGGVEWHAVDGGGFFAILEDGTAMIGTKAQYEEYKDQIQEAVGGFGTTLIRDGKICITASSTYYTNRASRTAVGITRTGKVVFMVLDGRQEPFSAGGSMEEIAQIMLEAGCVHAINLDGGGSTTFVAKQEGADELSVVNSPSDGFARSVATTLMMVSTAPSSTAFDHALLEAETAYMTVGSSVQIVASGVSATGNTAVLPEGTTWAVSDETVASITADGLLTGLATGEVTVNLMLGEQVLGSKTMYVVIPDNLYFTKDSMSAVYGETITLPIVALYQNKQVAITVNDVVFSLSNAAAGTVEGFTFTGIEGTGIKNVTVTAALAANTEVTATMAVALFNQGEATFDFDQATGGDRQFAWDRQVSNSTTKDNLTYMVVDPNEPMVTSYIFAIDMTQIPIPEQLSDLTSMLPGADVEGASAWTFLLQLAERVSVLTVVEPVVQIDPNFDVDYSNVTLVNEYFTLESVTLDEAANTLKMTLRWKDQTQAIDPESANPICILSGIKLTPKADAAWDSKDRLNPVNSGYVGYDIYLRANALYSFAQKEENQLTYGLYPFDNQDVIINGSTEKGAHFEDIYAEFSDTYTLISALKNGWYNEDGGYAYYVDGERLTGVAEVDGLYYDFGTEGINIGQNPYTGMFQKGTAKYYAQFGKLSSGWVAVDGYYYYFNPTTYRAHTGVSDIKGHVYTFNDEGQLILGAFVETELGTRYYWAGKLISRAWIETEDGILYTNDDAYLVYGHYPVIENTNDPAVWWHFDEETGIRTGLSDGFIWYNGSEYYCENGVWYYGVVQVGDGYIFTGTNGLVRKNASCYVSSSLDVTAGLAYGYYWCDADGWILSDGFATIDGYTYYFQDYVRATGFTKIANAYYFFNKSSGKMYTNTTLWVGGSNPYGIPRGYYEFGPDGRMILPEEDTTTGVVMIDGNWYLLIDGIAQMDGLHEFEGNYYYANSNGILATDETIWVSENKSNGLLADGSGYYAFDEEAKMVQTGFVTAGDATYYYEDAVRQTGLTQIGEDYYYFDEETGIMYADTTLWIGENEYGIEEGKYYFREDGTMDPNMVNELLDFAGMTMTLGNSLAVNFVFNTAKLEGDGHYAVITKQYADGTAPVSVTVKQSDWNVYSGSLYYFTFTGVKAKEMTDEFTVTVYNADGRQVSVAYTRTVEDYCYGLITKYEQENVFDAERLALYTDILNYGAAAQDFFQYNLENLANARVTEAQQAYATQSVEAEDIRVKGEGYAGSTLSLLNEILLNFVYNNDTINQAAYAVVTYTHHDGQIVDYAVEAEDFLTYGETRKYVQVTGLKVADGDQVVTVTLYDAAGNVLSVSQDSVNAYAVRKGDEHAVYPAVLKLVESAYNYFH